MAERVWDRFLTEQDKAHLARQGRRPVGFGTQPALLLVDLYRWVFGDRPQPLLESIQEWPASCGLAGWQALPQIRTLLDAARQAEIPIVHVTGLGGVGVPGWAARTHGGQGAPRNEADAERRRRRYDIVDEVAPRAGEAVLRKSSPSAFWGTPLVAHLQALRVDTVLTCGESTSGCVRASVVDGCTLGLRMIVAEECVFDRHEATHAINLFDLHQKYADVLPLADVLAYLSERRLAGRPAAATGD